MNKLYFVIYFQKINGSLHAKRHLLHGYHLCFMLLATSSLQFPISPRSHALALTKFYAPCSVIYMLHTTFPLYTFFTEQFRHLQFDPIFHNLLCNLVCRDYTTTQPCSILGRKYITYLHVTVPIITYKIPTNYCINSIVGWREYIG